MIYGKLPIYVGDFNFDLHKREDVRNSPIAAQRDYA